MAFGSSSTRHTLQHYENGRSGRLWALFPPKKILLILNSMTQIEDQQTMQPFIDHLQRWGCQVLRAVNRPNPYRSGFSILFRSDEATARAIGDLGIAQILLDIRADTYLLRLPEVNIDPTPGPHPATLPWNEVTKRQKLDELLTLWENSGDILERRRQRLGMFYKDE